MPLSRKVVPVVLLQSTNIEEKNTLQAKIMNTSIKVQNQSKDNMDCYG